MANDISKTNSVIEALGIDKKIQDKKKNGTLGQEEFLRILVAQTRNQNPMEPQENGEFLGQMAQFSTVSGLQEMQKSIDNMSKTMLSNQALQASSLVGRYVMSSANSGFLPEGEGDRFFGAVDVPESVADLKVSISNSAGVPVKTLNLGSNPEGLLRFSWDGLNDAGDAMPPGDYKINATAIIAGKEEALSTNFAAPVNSVTLGKNGGPMTLNVAGIGDMTMDKVKEIL